MCVYAQHVRRSNNLKKSRSSKQVLHPQCADPFVHVEFPP